MEHAGSRHFGRHLQMGAQADGLRGGGSDASGIVVLENQDDIGDSQDG